MRTTEILADIDKAIANNPHIAADSDLQLQVRELVAVLQKSKPLIKTLKKQKQGIARGFRDISPSEPKFQEQKNAMQALSAQLKSNERECKQNEAALLQLFHPAPNHNARPLHFLAPDLNNDDIAIQDIRIERCTDKKRWNSYVEQHRSASIYHLYDWQTLIKQSFSHDSICLIAVDLNNHIRGILPVTIIKSKLFGKFGVSIPYFNYGGPLADSDDVITALLDAATEIRADESLQHIEIRATHKLNKWQVSDDKVSMVLALPNHIEKLNQQLGSKVRAQIKQATAHSLVSKIGSLELLNDFYSVFARNMRDLGTPVYNKNFFRNILTKFAGHCTLMVVYQKSSTIACAFLVGYRDTLEIPWASTLRRANAMNTNMLLYSHVLEFSIKNNYDFFDFGRSTLDAPTYRFKKQWGAKPAQHYWHYSLADGHAMPQLNPSNPKYKVAIGAWKMLPVWLTKIIGPPIVKNLP